MADLLFVRFQREIEKMFREYYNMIIFGGATATGKTKAGVMLAKLRMVK